MKICPACSREYPNEHSLCRDDGVALVHLDTGSTGRAQELIGQIVDGRYRVERVVGRGGMGTVYACRHVVVGKSFAMKVLRSGIERSEEILQRFIREAQAANAVRSRHICEMSDFGQLPGGAFYVVMELLDGVSLTRALREKRLDRAAIKHVFIQIADTLERAHRAGIVHRDLKPDNVVLIEDEGDPHFVKLVDFGIAKMMQSKASNLTETGVILGTPYYMSPEQARGEQLDHRSDIYALGVMMYRAFTGQLPFVADTAMGVLTRHLTEKPELPSRLADMDTHVEQLILRCLEKKPIDRFQSMATLADALRGVSDQPRRADANPTVDERTGGLSSPMPRRQHPTPTEVATPLARFNQGGRPRQPTTDPPPTRPEPHAMPHPMPAPAMPSSMGRSPAPRQDEALGSDQPRPGSGDYAVGQRSSGEFAMSGQNPAGVSGAMAGLSSGNHAAPLLVEPVVGELSNAASLGSGELPSHLQGEAATNRGVVSSRISVRPRGNSRVAIAGAVAALLVVFVVVAVAFLGSGDSTASETGEAAESQNAATPSELADEEPPTDATEQGDPEAVETAESDASAAPDGEGGAPSSSATTSASAAAPPRPPPAMPYRPPPPPEPEPDEADIDEPMPEIRSPFED